MEEWAAPINPVSTYWPEPRLLATWIGISSPLDGGTVFDVLAPLQPFRHVSDDSLAAGLVSKFLAWPNRKTPSRPPGPHWRWM